MLPLIATPVFMLGTSATATMWVANAATTACVIVASAGKYAYDNFSTPDLPTFQHEAEVVGSRGLAEGRRLALETREKLALDEALSSDERARVGVELPRLASAVDTAESLNHTFTDIIATLPTQHALNHESLQVVSEEQKQQRSDIQEIKASLEEQLPRLIRANQEKQALLVENSQLKSTVEELRRQVSELSSGMNEALAMSEEMEAENFALKQQLNLANESKNDSMTSFSLNLFRS